MAIRLMNDENDHMARSNAACTAITACWTTLAVCSA
jgi:hypothetical protein